MFTSRRMYGNVATIDPWRSDPREYDHTMEITPKKLWVAALELNVEGELDGECNPGTDECAQEFDACEKSSDCCDTSLVCLNDICSRIMVN